MSHSKRAFMALHRGSTDRQPGPEHQPPTAPPAPWVLRLLGQLNRPDAAYPTLESMEADLEVQQHFFSETK